MNDQERLWSGEFGDAYHARQNISRASNLAFFARALWRTHGIRSIVEFGAGRGDNLLALRELLPDADIGGMEINEAACREMESRDLQWICGSILSVTPLFRQRDLIFTKGLLIHIAPEDLQHAYETLYRCSSHYILMAEYFSPLPREIHYRGQERALWARPFCEEMRERHPDLRLVDYGFVGRCDEWPQDDLTWWMMEKR